MLVAIIKGLGPDDFVIPIDGIEIYTCEDPESDSIKPDEYFHSAGYVLTLYRMVDHILLEVDKYKQKIRIHQLYVYFFKTFEGLSLPNISFSWTDAQWSLCKITIIDSEELPQGVTIG